MTLEEAVNTHLDELGENERNIWRYVAAHKQECQTITIGDLARACYVSTAAITRFTHKIGLSGFSELKMALKWQQEAAKSRPRANLVGRCLQDYHLTLEYLRDRDFSDVIDAIDGSRRIFAYGTGEVQRHAAKELKRLFINLNRQIFIIEGSAELDIMATMMTPADLLIVFSLSGENARVNAVVEEVKAKGSKIISFTSYEENTLAKMSDINLYYYNHCILEGETAETNCHLSAQFFFMTEILFVKYIEQHLP